MAPCLTPGCAKYNFHIGPCTQDEMIEQGCKRSRSTVPRYEAGAAPPPSLLHAIVAAQGMLPSDVSDRPRRGGSIRHVDIYSPRTEPLRKPEPRASGSRPSRKLQYPSKEDDGENENDDDDGEEEEEEVVVEGDDAAAAMSIALPSPGSLALQRMALLQQQVDQIKRDHGRPTEYEGVEGRYEEEAIRGRRVRKGATEAAAVDAPAKKSAPRRGRSSESMGALSAEPLTAGSKRSRRLPPPSGLAEPAKRRCDNDGGEGGSEGDEDEEGCPADHLIIKYGQCGAPACYKAALVRHSSRLRLPGTRRFALGCSTRARGASPLPLRTRSQLMARLWCGRPPHRHPLHTSTIVPPLPLPQDKRDVRPSLPPH